MTNSAFDTTLSQLLDAPRLTGVSTVAGRVVTTVQQLKHDSTGYGTQLWDVTDQPIQLTAADASVGAVEQARDGRIFFLSSRDHAAADSDAASAGGSKLWVLPSVGEPRVVGQPNRGLAGC